MLKKIASVRGLLTVLLLLSVIYAGYCTYYKVRYWGFHFTPKQNSNIWTIEAHISFEPTGEPIKVSLTTPRSSDSFKILEENVIAEGYRVNKNKAASRLIMTSPAQEKPQDIYYKIMLFDNADTRGKIRSAAPAAPQAPILDEQKLATAKQILALAKKQGGDAVAQIIHLLNEENLQPAVQAYLPVKANQQIMVEIIRELLSLKKIPSRTARGLRLEESKKALSPDLMVEAYVNGMWKLYDIKTGKKGIPENFVLFQRGGRSLLDIEGGENSFIKFSVLKSITSSMKLAGKRAKFSNQEELYKYSIYNLPLDEQNTLKWLSIFPLAILIIVMMRNVIGLQTMGTFTPMLLAMSLVKTGFGAGMLCFALIMVLGLSIRFLMSKFNLLLVPRISAVVIFVILIMQSFTVIGYQFEWNIAQSAVFFPIIIMAWIIERASITWEEDGALNACREIVFSVIVAIATYFVISNAYIRHIMFAFNELNLVILFVVMLLGTYTGYRLMELKRFRPLVKR